MKNVLLKKLLRSTIVFELVGDARRITIQMAFLQDFKAYMAKALKMHYPFQLSNYFFTIIFNYNCIR